MVSFDALPADQQEQLATVTVSEPEELGPHIPRLPIV